MLSTLENKKITFFKNFFFLGLIAHLFYHSFFSMFLRDEIEFIHTCWLISQGQTIYTDFFQHHHPLSYFLMVPFLKVFGETIQTFFLFRFIYFCLALGIVGLTYKIAKDFLNREVGYYSVYFLLTNLIFIYAGVKIRSDPWLTLFFLGSTYYFLNYYKKNNRFILLVSSILMGLGFLILQKAIFSIFVFGILLIYKFFNSSNKAKVALDIFLFAGGVIFVSILGYFLMVRASWGEYFFLNWKMNLNWSYSVKPWGILLESWAVNFLIWILSFCSLFKKNKPFPLGVISVIVLVLFGSIFVVKTPHWQYYLPLLPFLSILAGFFLASNIRLTEEKKLALFFVCALIPLIVSQFFVQHNFQKVKLKMIDFVLTHTEPDDLVYDGDVIFNLFRRDVDYFWFSIKQGSGGIHAYKKFRSYDYDLPRIIREKKPKIVSTFSLTPAAFSELGLQYEYISFGKINIDFIKRWNDHLYPLFIRKDE